MTTETPTARFKFGENWAQYLSQVSDHHLKEAANSFESFLGTHDLSGKRFLDIGCGSGVHSYVAYLFGASAIVSFDYDIASVETTRALKAKRAPDASHWTIDRGDILDLPAVQSLGTFDIVYAWGVLHHTGSMWKAIDNATTRVAPGGLFHLAIYNRHWTSPTWKAIKGFYCRSNPFIQKALLGGYAAADVLRILIRQKRNPFRYISEYSKSRGMRWSNDLRDWLGGYPYEYATPEELTAFVTPKGFTLRKVIPNASIGCSELLFEKNAELAHS